VLSQLYFALDREYILKSEFDDGYEHAGRIRLTINHGLGLWTIHDHAEMDVIRSWCDPSSGHGVALH